MEALSQMLTPAMIGQALQRSGTASVRRRRLPALAVVWLVIAMAVFRRLDTASAWRQVIGTRRALWWISTHRPLPCKAAFSAARRRLGARPMRLLFSQSAGPIATQATPKAFYHGLRLIGIDGVRLRIADTPNNRTAFGAGVTRREGKRIDAGYPQIHAVASIELGTHGIINALVKPGQASEQRACPYLLNHLPKQSLTLLDAGFYSYHTIKTAMDNRVQLLGRVGVNVRLDREQTLADGSFITTIYPSPWHKRRNLGGRTIRVIEYTFDDPNRPGYQERHRLYTTLLDAKAHRAKALVVLYHQRWEQEIAHDEVKTHQLTRDLPTHLRSLTPMGVVQEFYGLLIAYNGVRKLMHEAAVSNHLDPRQLSFTHAIRIVRETIPHMRAARTVELPLLYRAMLRAIAAGCLPPRRDRINPRVVKVKFSKYAKKRPETASLPQPQKPFDQSVAILK